MNSTKDDDINKFHTALTVISNTILPTIADKLACKMQSYRRIIVLILLSVFICLAESKPKKFKVKKIDLDYEEDDTPEKPGRARKREIMNMVEAIAKGKGRSQRDSKGNGLRKGHLVRNKRGKAQRLQQEFNGVPVFGYELTNHVIEAATVELHDKRTGRKTGRTLSIEREEYTTGRFVEDLDQAELGEVDDTNMRTKGKGLWRKMADKRGRNRGKGKGRKSEGQNKAKGKGGRGKGKGGKSKGKNRRNRNKRMVDIADDNELEIEPNSTTTVFPEGTEPIIYLDEESGNVTKAYLIKIFVEIQNETANQINAGPSYIHMIVDEDGEVIKEWDGLHSHRRHKREIVERGRGPGGNLKTGQYYYGQDKPLIPIQQESPSSCHLESEHVRTIHMQNYNYGYEGEGYNFPCYTQTGDAINGAYSPLNDAHYFANRIYDMYDKWYNTTPLDTVPLLVKVHYGENVENAFFDGEAMVFGDGQSKFYPLVSLDVMAHEVAHGITHSTSGLIYDGQSGGLNEAFSDMAGMAAKRFERDGYTSDFNWGLGHSITKGTKPLRCMDNPTCDGRSIDHVRDYWTGMDVHHSSGVFNKVFHYMASNLPYDIWDAFDIFYITNTKFWGQSTNFVEAAEFLLKAAEEIKAGKHMKYDYTHIDIDVVKTALEQVGINCRRLTTIWFCTRTY